MEKRNEKQTAAYERKRNKSIKITTKAINFLAD